MKQVLVTDIKPGMFLWVESDRQHEGPNCKPFQIFPVNIVRVINSINSHGISTVTYEFHDWCRGTYVSTNDATDTVTVISDGEMSLL
jgi:hypothetical protein